MNPVVMDVIGSLLRKFLAMASVWAVSYGIFTTDESAKIVEGLALLLTSIIWTLWKNYGNHNKVLTALESPAGTTLQQLTAKIKESK